MSGTGSRTSRSAFELYAFPRSYAIGGAAADAAIATKADFIDDAEAAALPLF